MVLMIVMIMGIMLGITGQSWQHIMKREKEEELIFRGLQIKNALDRWHNSPQGQLPATPLRDLRDLLKDPRTGGNMKYLRLLYKDPVTNSEWKLITDPVRGIVGVSSTSDVRPLKQGNFDSEMSAFSGKQKYSEWQFTYTPAKTAQQASEESRQQRTTTSSATRQ